MTHMWPVAAVALSELDLIGGRWVGAGESRGHPEWPSHLQGHAEKNWVLGAGRRGVAEREQVAWRGGDT